MSLALSDVASTLASLPQHMKLHLPARLEKLLHDVPLWQACAIPGVLAYLLLCRALRFRRERAMRMRYGFPDRASLARMTTADAQRIIQELNNYEFPTMTTTGLQFGLFKTYAVETISKLLLATRNLTDPVASKKRYEDTAVIIGEFLSHPPSSDRAVASISRMNFLHAKYVADKQISNADLLYTLSVFVTEPARFVRLYDWRPLNDMERCAYGAFWKEIGDAMGIEYAGFLDGARGGAGWRDGLEFFEDIARWAKGYEVVAFRPSQVNHKPAEALIPMITHFVPRFAQPFAQECVHVLLGDRMREAMLIPEPGISAAAVVYTSLVARRFFLRHLALPRLRPINRHLAGPAAPDDRLQTAFSYGNEPFYVRPTFWKRWGPAAWLWRALGARLPGDAPDEHHSAGFRWDELGPRNRMGTGADEMARDQRRMREKGMGGCPF